MTTSCIALLGRKDEPTDAIEEYCHYLGTALLAHDIQLDIHRVPWEIHGWPDALQALQLQAAQWRDTWVLVQYTALAWSVRGFPKKVLRALKILKSAGARLGIVFHDVEPYPGARLIDSVRRFLQVRTMRRALALADLAVFTVPPEKLSWLPAVPPQAAFIPVGPNLPVPPVPPEYSPRVSVPTIGIFSVTGGESGARETEIIIASVRHAAEELGKLRLSVFGRHAELREADLRYGLRDLPVALLLEGVVEPAQVVQKLSICDVLLFIRGPISSRRSSAIAGIACGLPLIAFSGSETAAPITEAGVVLISEGNDQELGPALVRVLSNDEYRKSLGSQSRDAYERYFSWAQIARNYTEALGLGIVGSLRQGSRPTRRS
jgi:glycosyltransferase involved in cell wall biosynthesis